MESQQQGNLVQYPASELVENSEGRVYHLAIPYDALAKKIILVGDPGRVDLVASLFDDICHSSYHREFAAKSGHYKGKYITVMSTGIGTDNMEITLNELDACVNIDLEKRVDKQDLTSLEIVRIGTCGILQKDLPLFSYILSSYAYGFDNVGHFYDIHANENTNCADQIKLALDEHIKDAFPMEFISPYIATPDESLLQKLSSEKTVSGITVTSSGFYAPQGRALRLPTKTKNLNSRLMSFSFSVPTKNADLNSEENHDDIRVLNYEMESSALYALGRGLGHRCATICLGLANRADGKFTTEEYESNMLSLVEYVLDRI